MGDARAGKFPLLGFDPTPGDVDRTRALARQLGDLHGELTATVTELDRLDCGYWKGEAATAFVSHIDSDVAPLIKKAHDSFGRASSALSRWADQLHGFQAEADALEKEAATKQGSLDHAKSAADPPHPPGDRPAFVTPAQLGKDAKAQQAVTDATNALDGVRHRAEELHNRFTTAATSISHDLDKAGDIAPDKPGLFSRLAHGVEDAWNDTVQWVNDNADIIKLIGDLLSDLSGILGMLAILTLPFEPIGAIFAGLAVATSALALATHLIAKLAGADVSWLSIGFDALGSLPGLTAFTKGASTAVKGVTAAERAVQLGRAYKVGSAITKGATEGINWVGKADEVVSGGVKFKNIALWGKKSVEGISATGMKGRLAMVAENNIAKGQLIGTKGWNLIAKESRLAVDPLTGLGRNIDAGLKLAPKVWSIPQHIGEAVHLGDRFHQSASDH
ncbi:putative T7SS-secreted protein [Streptomyces sp. NPDC087422]|uniref:putative T7SS-secreted protein n=1 Tax=Streptomyces sp. NPDC087422 TaxID=3365786 RepID=UPI003800AD7C